MTSLPDPAADLIGFLRALGEVVETLLRDRDAARMGPTQAERSLGYPQSYLSPSRYPWRTPDFGARGTMLILSVWRAWNETPEGGRRATWDAMSLAERRQLLGLDEGKRRTA